MNKRQAQKIISATIKALRLSWDVVLTISVDPPDKFGDASIGTRGMCIPNGATRTADIWLQPSAEPEIAVHEVLHIFYVENGHDKPDGESNWQTEAAINMLAPLILKAIQ